MRSFLIFFARAALLEGYFESFPDDLEKRLRIVKYLEAADLLGHLGWSLKKNCSEEYKKTFFRMNEFYPSRR